MNRKVLLMGASGSGKTSMRSVIFSNNVASATSRLSATIDVEQNHVRFFGALVLHLWDCGGQDAFLQSFLSTQRSTVFQHVGVLIYVFDVETREFEKDLTYYRDVLAALRSFSPGADVFVLVHKMDLVGRKERSEVFERKRRELVKWSGDTRIRTFGTSIWDESLYKAWSRIVHTLIPNAPTLSRHLTTFARICSATEVVLFERTTFLVIARSGTTDDEDEEDDGVDVAGGDGEHHDPNALNPKRFEKISELVKMFKVSCSQLQEQFHSLEIRFPNYTALLEILTANMYVMVVVADPNVQSAALKLNVRLAREKFEQLQAGPSAS